MKSKIFKTTLFKFGLIILVSFLTGYFFAQLFHAGGKTKEPLQFAQTQAQTQVWTCSMHPQIRQPKPGLCPICGMELIAVESKEDKPSSVSQLQLSPYARKLAGIQTAPAERKYVEVTIRMAGKIDYDETRLAYISSRIAGRIDKLYVDYTGIAVNKGDHMAYIYSPDLLSAQQELIQAIKTAGNLSADSLPAIRKSSQMTINAIREKLRLWGITEEQISRIEKQSQPSDHITVYSPITGIVIDKNAVEGMYVATGERIYTVADLNRLWIKLDAYESDLAWIKYGQEVEFSTESYPGEIFSGRISFIDPVLNDKTRTVKVRVNIENPSGKLKPEMFVRAQVRAKITAGGKVITPAIAGKWISPMHPEIIKDAPGKCDVCGMPLVPAESLGFVGQEQAGEPPLVIPASAPLITGKRAVVYVELPDNEGVYQGREIVLGPRAGDYYIVKSGLDEGEKLVVNGNFKIDSAVQIQAQPSMMNPPDKIDKIVAPEHLHGQNAGLSKEFVNRLSPVFDIYFEIQQDLSNDDLLSAVETAKTMHKSISDISAESFGKETEQIWTGISIRLNEITNHIMRSSNISHARESFQILSDYLFTVAIDHGLPLTSEIYRLHCPMAFSGRGADWLQREKQIRNPYFGKSMLNCGEITRTVKPAK